MRRLQQPALLPYCKLNRGVRPSPRYLQQHNRLLFRNLGKPAALSVRSLQQPTLPLFSHPLYSHLDKRVTLDRKDPQQPTPILRRNPDRLWTLEQRSPLMHRSLDKQVTQSKRRPQQPAQQPLLLYGVLYWLYLLLTMQVALGMKHLQQPTLHVKHNLAKDGALA